ncbi:MULTISPECIES: O-antigen ligase family protein [Colwellia]|uniref:Membrane protein n=1 Tax=Colwellia marinimaniae TaxID=1513592 RepID=A0ABQ0MYK8_9GAMM|nr:MULTISPECIES: O-antigen ligase family protein [Colwellia]GAW97408.1 membrane protein [Colwellia marinimaniae]
MTYTPLNITGLAILLMLSTLTLYLFPHPIILIIIGLAPFVLWGMVNFSFAIVLAFIIFSFFRIHEVFPILEPLKLPLLLALAAIFIIFLRASILQNLHAYWCPQFTYLILFSLLVTIAVPFASNVAVATKAWTGVYSKIILITFIIAWMMRKESHFISASRVFIFAGAVVGLVALYNKFNGIGLVEGTRVTIGRDIGSLLGDPNDLALVLLYPMAFAIATFLEQSLSKFERLFSLTTFCILLYALLATQSRGGLLGFLAVISLFAYKRIRSKVLLFTGGAMALTVLFTVAKISERASGGAAEVGIDESAMGRLYAWQAAWNMALDNPILGVGINNFYYNYFFYSSHWDGLNHAVHSTWFGVLAESGFVGLILFVTLIVSTLLMSLKMLNTIKVEDHTPGIRVALNAAPAGIIGFIVSGTFLTQGFIWPIYLQVALVIALNRYLQPMSGSRTT